MHRSTFTSLLIISGVLFTLTPQAAPCIPLAAPSQQAEAGGMVVTGVVTAEHQAALSVRMPARIVAVLAAENQAVKKGQVLIQLDDSDLRAQLESARSAVRAAKSQEAKAAVGRSAQMQKADADILAADGTLQEATHKLKLAQTGLDAAISENAADLKTAQSAADKAHQFMDRAVTTLHDLEALNKVGGVSRNDLEGARLQANAAQSDYEAALDGIKRLKEGPNGVPYKIAIARADLDAARQGVTLASRGVDAAKKAKESLLKIADQDIKSAHASVLQALAGVDAANAAVGSMKVVSPLSGTVASINARTGETAQPGMPLLTVVDLNSLRLEALVLTRQLPLLHRGSRLIAVVDSQPNRTIQVVVSDIAPVAEPDQRSIKVRFKFLTPVSLRAGVSARITLAAPTAAGKR
jgi:multidrug resistance efflux pump